MSQPAPDRTEPADDYCMRDAVRTPALAHTCAGYGPERTAAQDIGFGLRQLTDVTNKALSPGINDPTTAIHALGHASALLVEMAGLDLGADVLRDQHQSIRVVLHRPSSPT